MTDIQEQIAEVLADAVRKSARVEDWAAVAMPLVKRAQAEALRDAAQEPWVEGVPSFPVPGVGFVTAYFMLNNRADQIEKEAGA